jgi:hypothetical protein
MTAREKESRAAGLRGRGLEPGYLVWRLDSWGSRQGFVWLERKEPQWERPTGEPPLLRWGRSGLVERRRLVAQLRLVGAAGLQSIRTCVGAGKNVRRGRLGRSGLCCLWRNSSRRLLHRHIFLNNSGLPCYNCKNRQEDSRQNSQCDHPRGSNLPCRHLNTSRSW